MSFRMDFMNSIKKLLEPGRIGNLELKNRVIYSAMDLRSTDRQGHISEEAALSLIERARHGVGLVSLPASILTSRKAPPTARPFHSRATILFPSSFPL